MATITYCKQVVILGTFPHSAYVGHQDGSLMLCWFQYQLHVLLPKGKGQDTASCIANLLP